MSDAYTPGVYFPTYVKRYSDDQPRDDNGRFGSGGESSYSGSATAVVSDIATAQEPTSWAVGSKVESADGKVGSVTGHTKTGAMVKHEDGSEKIVRQGDGYTVTKHGL